MSVTISEGNAKPVANASTITVLQNITYTGNLSASDPEGNSLTYSMVSTSTLGSVSLSANTGEFTYTPGLDALGTDQFSFKVNDGQDDSGSVMVTVNIISVEQACGSGGVVPRLDSDGDGYVDVLEIAFATDPNDAESLPDYVLGVCFSALSDGIKPRLIGFDVTTPTIDIAAGDNTVTYALSLLDNASGLKRARISLRSPSGTLVTATQSFDSYPLLTPGKLAVTAFGAFAEDGVWEVSTLTLFDEAGNRLNLVTSDLTGAGYPTMVTVANSNGDSMAPALDDLTVLTPIVYPGTANDQMSVSLSMSDADSGISSARIDFISVSGTVVSASQTLSANFASATIQLDTGTLSQYLESGLWTIYSVLLVDAAGNSVELSDQLIGMGFDNTLQVTNPLSDANKPALNAFSVLTTEVYPAAGDARMSFSVIAADDAAGIQRIRVDLQGPSGQVLQAWGEFNENFPLNATVQVNTAVLSGLTETGTWNVVAVEVFDDAGNSRLYTSDDLANQGYPITLQAR